MELKAIRINCLVQVGDLSQEKITRVHDAIKEEFPTLARLPFGVNFVNPIKGRNILITAGQISFIDENKSEPHLETTEVGHWLHIVFNTLLLDPSSEVVFNYVGHVVREQAQMDFLLKRVGMFEELPGVAGLGLKIYIIQPNYQGEIKVEPFLADPSRLFLELKVNGKEKLSLDDMLKKAEVVLNDFKTYSQKITEVINH